MSQVTISALGKTFGATRALDALDLTVEDGEFVVLLGPSGCGKTTALRCLAGLDHPDQGAIRMGGRVTVDAATGAFVPANRRDIGMVFQSYALWPHMTVAANVGYPLKMRGRGRDDIRRRVAEVLDLVGLAAHAARYPGELSGGQQQRVALARALSAEPALVLFDEPLSNLDAQLRLRLRDEIRRIHGERRRTSIYVTHDQSEALTLADRIVLMRDGRIEQQGSPDEIFLSPRNRFVAEFVGIANFLPGTVTGPARFLPDGWGREIAVAQGRLPPGTRATAAFRASAAQVTGDSDGVPATLLSAQYTGETFDARVEVAGHRITAAMPLHHGVARARAGAPVRLTLNAPEILLLSEDGGDIPAAAMAAE